MSGQLLVAYRAPASDGGSPVTSYEVTFDGGATWWPCVGVTGTCTLTSLTNGTEYTVALRAVNAIGTGPSSVAGDRHPVDPRRVRPGQAREAAEAAGLGQRLVQRGQQRPRRRRVADQARRRHAAEADVHPRDPRQGVVETHLTVKAILPDGRVKKVKGAWGWMSDRSAVFRPMKYWPGNATITVTSTLDRAVMGKSGSKYVVGSRDLGTTWTFRTARKLIAKVDGAKVNMRVWIDGEKVKTFPVSLGKDEWETRNGVKVISTQKEAAEGLPQHVARPRSRGGVRARRALEHAPHPDRRVHPHGARGPTARIGRYNGSHGCTNMFEQDAKWIYDKTIPGDVVLYENTGGNHRPVLERCRRPVEHPVGPVAEEVGARQRRSRSTPPTPPSSVGRDLAGGERLSGFDAATSVSLIDDGRFAWTVPDWLAAGPRRLGRPRRRGAGARPCSQPSPTPSASVRSISVQMMAPAVVGPHVIETRIVRRGSAMSTWSARPLDRERCRGRVDGGDHGTRRASPSGPTPAASGERSPRRSSRRPTTSGRVPSGPPLPVFTQHLDMRPVSGLPLSGEPAATLGWLGLREQSAPSAATLLALVDAWWPASLPMLAEMPRVATVNFTANLLVDPATIGAGEMLLHESFVTAAADGFASEHRRLWTADGRLAVDNLQTMVIGS